MQQKRENALEDVALVTGTQQNLSNQYSLDIYGLVNLLCLLIWTVLLACPQMMLFLPSQPAA
jgi:hypothetical protein